MSLDFSTAIIRIRENTDNWGSFRFDFTGGYPTGATISSATVKSYLNSTETTSDLIESGSIVVSHPYVDLKLQYPGSSYEGHHKLVFTLTFDVGGATEIQDYNFGYVLVE